MCKRYGLIIISLFVLIFLSGCENIYKDYPSPPIKRQRECVNLRQEIQSLRSHHQQMQRFAFNQKIKSYSRQYEHLDCQDYEHHPRFEHQ